MVKLDRQTRIIEEQARDLYSCYVSFVEKNTCAIASHISDNSIKSEFLASNKPRDRDVFDQQLAEMSFGDRLRYEEVLRGGFDQAVSEWGFLWGKHVSRTASDCAKRNARRNKHR